MKVLTLSIGLLLAAAPVAAQEPAAPAEPRDTMIVNYTFTQPSTEILRMTLRGGEVYRAELVNAGQVTFRSKDPGVQKPRVREDMMGPGADGSRRFDIEPFATAEYEVRVGQVARGSAMLKVFWDANATAKRQKKESDN